MYNFSLTLPFHFSVQTRMCVMCSCEAATHAYVTVICILQSYGAPRTQGFLEVRRKRTDVLVKSFPPTPYPVHLSREKDCASPVKWRQEVPIVETGSGHNKSTVPIREEADNCFLLWQCWELPLMAGTVGIWHTSHHITTWKTSGGSQQVCWWDEISSAFPPLGLMNHC